jgi:hypothetical protein
MEKEPELITHTLRDWLKAQGNDREDTNELKAMVAEWALDAMEDNSYKAKDVIRHLETVDCAACHAPSGLIYNVDLADKLKLHWDDVNDAVEEYHDATGEWWHPGLMADAPRGAAFNVLSYVWFAVEWYAQDLARLIEGKHGRRHSHRRISLTRNPIGQCL